MSKRATTQQIRIVLIQERPGGAVARLLAPQWVTAPGGERLALVQMSDEDARALTFPDLVRLAAGQLDISTLPQASAAAIPAPTGETGAAPGSAGVAAADARTVIGTERVTGGQFLDEHYERVRKRIARTATQDGVRIGDIAFDIKGNVLTGRAPVLSS